MTNLTVADALRLTKTLLTEKTWRKCVDGQMDANGFCMMTATKQLDSEMEYKADKYLKRALDTNLNGCFAFNDRPETTLADIHSVYDKAIELAEKDGV